jgi:hypothetical protein
MKFIQKYYYLFTGIFVFLVYLLTMAPSVVQIDSGELAAAQMTLGIAHPTGYPLFTIIGYLFSFIPLPFTKIFQLNLLASIYCASAVTIFVFTLKYTFDNVQAFRKPVDSIAARKKRKKEKPPEEKTETLSEQSKMVAAVFGGLALAFSKTFWFQSTSVEVYSLHLLLICLIILFLLKAFVVSEKETETKLWLFFAIVLAFGFTNHMTTLLILPGVAYLFFIRYGFNSKSFKRIFIMMGIFIPVLILIYSYLPIRASQNPVLNWGNPVDLERILRHISGKQYQVWLFSSIEAAKKQFTYFFESLPVEFTFTLILSLAGMVFSFVLARKLFLFLFITFVWTVLYSINYDINDIDAYFLLAYITLAFFAAATVLKILNTKNISLKTATAILIIIISGQIYFNFKKTDQSNVYTFEDYTQELVGSVPENSIIISYQWDYFLSASYYYQFVENYRRDVTIVDKELLRRSWYFNQLDYYDPELLKEMKPVINQFKQALQPFERSEQYNGSLLESLFRKIMTDIIATNIDERNIYIAPELFENEMQRGEFILPEGYILVPELFLLKVTKDRNYSPINKSDFKIRFPENRNIYIDKIENLVGASLARRAMYEMNFGMNEIAKRYVKKIITDLPGYKIPAALTKLINN